MINKRTKRLIVVLTVLVFGTSCFVFGPLWWKWKQHLAQGQQQPVETSSAK